jgi:hypothetical protein
VASCVTVSDQSSNLARPWRVIAEELSRETNQARVLELSRELNQALKEQGFQVHGDGEGAPR